MSAVLDRDRDLRVARINYAIKAGLAVVFAIAILVPPDTLEGKGMAFRAPLFLAPAVLVPLIARWRDWAPYPHTGDALLSAPFLLDTLGVVKRDIARGFERTIRHPVMPFPRSMRTDVRMRIGDARQRSEQERLRPHADFFDRRIGRDHRGIDREHVVETFDRRRIVTRSGSAHAQNQR